MSNFVVKGLGAAAKLCHISRGGMQQRVKTGKVGTQINGEWYFTAEDVHIMPQVGRPKGARGKRKQPRAIELVPALDMLMRRYRCPHSGYAINAIDYDVTDEYIGRDLVRTRWIKCACCNEWYANPQEL